MGPVASQGNTARLITHTPAPDGAINAEINNSLIRREKIPVNATDRRKGATQQCRQH